MAEVKDILGKYFDEAEENNKEKENITKDTKKTKKATANANVNETMEFLEK